MLRLWLCPRLSDSETNGMETFIERIAPQWLSVKLSGIMGAC